MADQPTTPRVFKALADVREAINKAGIVKDREVTEGVRFKFRGIDNVLNEFSGPMATAGLMIVPSYDQPVVTIRDTKNGKTFNTVVRGSYRALSTTDGSSIELGSFYGEANDTQDKSMAKAQSIALRQAYLQTFVVPLGPEMDPEMTEYDDVPPRQDASQEGPKSKSLTKDEPAAGPAGVPDLTPPQRKILDSKLKAKSLSFDAVPGDVLAGGFNSVQDWIKQQ